MSFLFILAICHSFVPIFFVVFRYENRTDDARQYNYFQWNTVSYFLEEKTTCIQMGGHGCSRRSVVRCRCSCALFVEKAPLGGRIVLYSFYFYSFVLLVYDFV